MALPIWPLAGALGTGALIGAGCLPFVKRHASVDRLLFGGTLRFGAVTLVSPLSHHLGLLTVTMLEGGFAWMLFISSLNIAARMIIPARVQARCLAVYLLIFQGGMAVGSFRWGLLPQHAGVRWALAWAGAGLMLTVPLAHSMRYSLALLWICILRGTGRSPRSLLMSHLLRSRCL